MHLSRIAARQKRYKDILDYARNELSSPDLKAQFEQTLSRYQTVLARCWKAQSVSPEDAFEMDSVERDLERLFGEARYFSRGNQSSRSQQA
jgi:hypothetical protein